MKNKRPIFLNSFSRGGSSIIWNLLQSHPSICSPLLETHQCFLGETFDRKLRRNLQFDWKYHSFKFHPQFDEGQLTLNYGTMNPSNMRHRKIPLRMRNDFDEILFQHKCHNLENPEFRYKSRDEIYTRGEVEASRLVCKNINGISWLSYELAEMYPDAIFLCLVRDGFSMLESRLRRKSYKSAEKFGYVYQRTIDEMTRQVQDLPNCHLVKFEDFLGDPEKFITSLFDLAGENSADLTHLRLKRKAHYEDGEYITSQQDGSHVWIERAELPEFINVDTNADQMARLSEFEIAAFLEHAEPAMKSLDYIS